MKRQPLFIAIELVVLLSLEAANALTIAPISLSNRIAVGALGAVFVAMGFFIPASPKARTALLFVDALFIGLMAAFTGMAVCLTVLLPMRCMELKQRDRRALMVCIVYALWAFALSTVIGAEIEHRPAAVLAAPVLIPLFALILSLVALSEELRRSSVSLAMANAELILRAERWQQIATAKERYQLGRDLRNEVGPGLKAIGDELERALSQSETDTQAARAFTFRAQRTAQFTLAGLDRTVDTLRDASLGQGDLATNLRDMCDAFAVSGAPRMLADIADVSVRDPMVAAGLERIAREALINVAHHSQAFQVRLTFARMNDQLELLIDDDGIGFEPGAVTAGNGLAVIRDRAAQIGGTCTIESAPAQGTVVRVTLPQPTAST